MSYPHVLVDGYFLSKPYGFGRFVSELCRALGRARREISITVAVPDRAGEDLLPSYPGLKWYRIPDANFIVWEQFTIPRLARKLSCDLIHFPYNTRAIFMRGTRSVTTVHDLLFLDEIASLKNLKAFVAEKYAKIVFRLASVRSDAIVSVSETTQRLLQARGISSTVVNCTVDGFLELIEARPVRGGRPYLLHRGGYMPHRNTGRVIEAFRLAQPNLPPIDLKIFGVPAGREVWKTTDDPAIQFLPRLSDAELALLYTGASSIVATSLVEGFGLPIIEGFGCGTPVITSDIDPMREVAGGAAVLVDPRNVTEISSAMIRVVTETATADAMVMRGRDRLRNFSSEALAQKMLQVYGCCARVR